MPVMRCLDQTRHGHWPRRTPTLLDVRNDPASSGTAGGLIGGVRNPIPENIKRGVGGSRRLAHGRVAGLIWPGCYPTMGSTNKTLGKESGATGRGQVRTNEHRQKPTTAFYLKIQSESMCLNDSTLPSERYVVHVAFRMCFMCCYPYDIKPSTP